jgi:hypothetical protein
MHNGRTKAQHESHPVPNRFFGALLQHEVDLAVIGRGALQGTLGRLRTHAYGIIRQSPCPVLSM